MKRHFPIPLTILVELHFALDIPAILGSGVIFSVAFTALQGNFINRAFFGLCHILKLPYKKIPLTRKQRDGEKASDRT